MEVAGSAQEHHAAVDAASVAAVVELVRGGGDGGEGVGFVEDEV